MMCHRALHYAIQSDSSLAGECLALLVNVSLGGHALAYLDRLLRSAWEHVPLIGCCARHGTFCSTEHALQSMPYRACALLQSGCDVNLAAKNGSTPLHIATKEHARTMHSIEVSGHMPLNDSV